MKTLFRVFLLSIVATLAAPASAAPLTYFGDLIDPVKPYDDSNADGNADLIPDLPTSRATAALFTATLSSFGVEDLEGAHISPGFLPPSLIFGASGITAVPDFEFVAPAGFLAVSGTNLLLDKGLNPRTGQPQADSLTFNQPITAFGAYFAQGGDGPANTLTFRLENTILGTDKHVKLTIGQGYAVTNIFFFGITDTAPFDKITMTESNDNDGILLDDIHVGYVAPVPEPSSLALIGIGGAALVVGAIRRRTARRS